MASLNPKLPVALVSSVVCLCLGIGGGAVGAMIFFEYNLVPDERTLAKMEGKGPQARMKRPGPPGGKRGKKGKKQASKFPVSKYLLVSLVDKLHLLTVDRPKLKLDGDQQTALAKQLSGLQGFKELDDAEAKKRLNAAWKSLSKENQQILQSVGFRDPSQFGRRRRQLPKIAPNPFAEEKNRKQLQSLQEKLPPVS